MSEQYQQQKEEEEEHPPTDNSTTETVPQLRRKKSICLFGLSADPPTGYGGHVGIVQTLLQQEQQNQWDEISLHHRFQTGVGKRCQCAGYVF